MTWTLRLLGGASLTGPEGPAKGPAAQRHRLALLALLAASPRRSIARDKAMALLWPEQDVASARQLLNQAVHVIRRTIGPGAIVTTGDDLSLDPSIVSCDVVAFDEALDAGTPEDAVRHYAGPFVDGFFLSESPEFEQWADRQRHRLASAHADAVEGLATAATRAGDAASEVRWWKLRAEQDPLDSRVAGQLMLAMERAGNRAGAVQQGREHQQRLARELEIAPDPAIDALIERLRRETNTRVPESEPASHAPATLTVPPPAGEPLPTPASEPQRRWRGATIGALALAALVIGFLARRPASVAPTPAVVDEIATAVAAELTRRARDVGGPTPREQRTRNIAAYEAFLRGADPILLRSDSAARHGLAYMERAVALDSGYAAAWAGLARLTNRVTGNTPDQRARALDQSETAARRAIALDDSLADAHATLAFVYLNRGALAGAETELRRAIALEPDAARYHESLVRLYVWWERPADALVAARRALTLAPVSPTANAELARALLASGRPAEALAQLDRLRQLDPPLLRVASLSAQCLDRLGRTREAMEAVRPSATAGQVISVGLFGYLLARAGEVDSARRFVATLERENRNALNVGLVYAGLGDIDRALLWFDRAIDDWSLRPGSESLAVQVILAEQQRDPRVQALRRRLGLS